MVMQIRCTFPILLLLLICSPALWAANDSTYTVEGKVGIYSAPAKIFLVYRDIRDRIVEDSCTLQNGRFAFSGSVDYPLLAHLYLTRTGDRNQVIPEDAISFYLDAGKIRIQSTEDLRKASVTGSHTHDLNIRFQESLISIQQRGEEIRQSFLAASPEKQNDQAFNDSLTVLFEAVQSEYNAAALSFILSHPDEMLGVHMLQSQINTYPNDRNVEPVFEQMSERVRNSLPGKRLAATIRKFKTLDTGVEAPAFRAPDINGKEVGLSEFKGKYVLLVFWSPTCHHCLGEIPIMKELYTKYRERGLEIVSFALEREDNKQEWLDVVAGEGMSWTNLSDLKEWKSEILESYKTFSVPKNYLIDREGIIIKSELYGAQLVREIEEIFKK